MRTSSAFTRASVSRLPLRGGVGAAAISTLLLCTFAGGAFGQTSAPSLANKPAASPPSASITIPDSPRSAPASNSSGNAAAISAPNNYQLSANDQVAIEVFGEDDLRTNARLNSDGNVSLPLLGSVRLAGLTLGQAASRLTEMYGRDYLVHPRVNVTLVGYAKRRFTVLGQVGRPGSFEMPEGSPGGIDLLEAIAMAGGYTRIAAPERISVRRGDKVFRVDGKRVAKGGSENFTVEAGDTITVGESIF